MKIKTEILDVTKELIETFNNLEGDTYFELDQKPFIKVTETHALSLKTGVREFIPKLQKVILITYGKFEYRI